MISNELREKYLLIINNNDEIKKIALSLNKSLLPKFYEALIAGEYLKEQLKDKFSENEINQLLEFAGELSFDKDPWEVNKIILTQI